MTKRPNLPPQEIETVIWQDKYRFTNPDGSSDEQSFEDTNARVVVGVYEKDKGGDSYAQEALHAMNKREWCPAGRIHAGAGTDREVTLINCFVMPTIEDSMITEVDSNSLGIMDSLKVAALTQRMGGGIGMDFSTLRPKGAIVSKIGAPASGPLSFMEMWNSMCSTIMSAGARRGAMMGTLMCDHPDIQNFITAKQTKGYLTNFNVSVLVTDPFMEAVKNNEPWELKFDVPKYTNTHERIYESITGKKWYVYETVSARELWNEITRSTYEYAEPGVIFIDRVNNQNNLKYCEEIRATNPCAEEPLPPNGDCNLGAINLAVMVRNPFTPTAEVDLKRIGEIARIAMRFLDNVIDVAKYPTHAMEEEAKQKRRTGLGITGLGNMLQQMQYSYGSNAAIDITDRVMRTIRDSSYQASVDLAKERQPFPAFDRDKYLKSPFINTLPESLQQSIYNHGIRNGVLLTIAPTGTTSIYYGNVSSGIEPTFAWKYQRKVLQPDNTLKIFDVVDYGYRLYESIFGKTDVKDLPSYMVSTNDLYVSAHVKMQAVCQEYIDASISKTINCPEEMSFEDFQNVYLQAYEMGCKGCTTYRPCPETDRVRGSILSIEKEKEREQPVAPILVERPSQLFGSTYKVKWLHSDHAYYITINDYIADDGSKLPFEIFINTKDTQHQEWVSALTRSLSAIFRRGGDISFVPAELKEVHSATGQGAWVDKKYVPSLVALIGSVVEQHFQELGILGVEEKTTPNIYEKKLDQVVNIIQELDSDLYPNIKGSTCPKCYAPALVHQEGCDLCLSCGFSNCG